MFTGGLVGSGRFSQDLGGQSWSSEGSGEQVESGGGFLGSRRVWQDKGEGRGGGPWRGLGRLAGL